MPATTRWLRLILAGFALVVSTQHAVRGQTPAPLTFSFSPAGTPYTLTRKEPDVEFAFRIDALKEGATGTRLAATPFVDEQGRPFDAQLFIDGKPAGPQTIFDVPAAGFRQVRLKAKLPGPGSYTSHLTLIYGDQPQPAVAVTVRRPDLALEILDIPPVRAAGGAASIPVTFRETTGQTVTLARPRLTRLTIDTGGQVKFHAEASQRLLDEAGQDVPDDIPLADGSSRVFSLLLEELPGPGQYDGSLRFSQGENLPPVDKAFAVYLRRHWFVAFLWILVGVVVSSVLRKYLVEERPRLQEERRTQLLLNELDESTNLPDKDPREIALVQTLRRQLNDVLARLGSDVPLADTRTRLDTLEKKVPLAARWIARRREVRVLEPATLRGPFETKLNTTERMLLDGAATVAAIQTEEQVLLALPGEIESAVRTHLTERIDAFTKELDTTLRHADASLASVLGSLVRPELDRAREILEIGDLPEAAAALAKARSAYAGALANDLAARVAGPSLEGLTPTEWEQVRARVEAALSTARHPGADPEEAVAAVRTAQAFYLEGIATPLLRRIADDLARIGDEPTKQAERAELERIRGNLENGLNLIAAGTLDQAAAEILRAHQDLISLPSRIQQLGNTPSADPEAESIGTPPMPLFLGPLRFLLSGPEAATPAATAAAIDRRITRADWFANVAVLLVAAVLGVSVLWIPDLTWGGFADSLTAFLWGLGLHQFSFTGIRGLMERFTTS